MMTMETYRVCAADCYQQSKNSNSNFFLAICLFCINTMLIYFKLRSILGLNDSNRVKRINNNSNPISLKMISQVLSDYWKLLIETILKDCKKVWPLGSKM